MKHILVGTDGSEGAATAMRWASEIASRLDADVIVMTCFQPVDSELRPGRLETLLARQEVELAAWVEAAPLGDVPVRTIVERGDPRDIILGVAEREDADLIVVGRAGRSGGPGLFRIGSMAEWLAHHVDRPVAIVTDGSSPTLRHVLVGVDGSDGSRAAVAWVRDLALNSAGVRVLAASVERPGAEGGLGDLPEDRRVDVEHLVRDEFAKDMAASDVELDVATLLGTNAADALLEAARDQQSDLVVVGARALGGLTGLRIGGVALRTVHQADRSIVLVPPS